MTADPLEPGGMRITPVVTSRFRLDGGSMFGVIPKVLWSRQAPADDRNRIVMNVNSLLVETAGVRILVEAGMGLEYDERWTDIYALGRMDAVSALNGVGVSPQDVDIVILTHLHLDHAGGCTVRGCGKPEPAFPRARYLVQEEEWECAADPHPLAGGSYRDDDFKPLLERGRLELVRGGYEPAPGVRVEPTGGHTRGHQIVRLSWDGGEAIYLGDIIPTTAHLPLNWLMSWDMEPTVVYEQRARLLEEALDRSALLFFTHDPKIAACRLEGDGRGGYRPDAGSIVEAPL